MSKVGVLVLGSWGPLILDRVLAAFDDERFRFLLHIDAKHDQAAYTAKMQHAGRLTLIENRAEVYWGGFSMIEAELALVEAALRDNEITSLVLVSDDTAPLHGPDAVYRALMEAPDRITCTPNGRPKYWYEGFFYTDSRFVALRGVNADEREFRPHDFEMILRLERLRAKGKRRIETMYFGRQWWALSRASAAKILEFLRQDQHFVESFRFSLFPDETFFPTAFRICFPDRQTPDIPTYADYGRPVHPWQFTAADEICGTAFGPEHLFVRKIKIDMPEVIDDLAAGWAR
jgi:hypothetical protein